MQDSFDASTFASHPESDSQECLQESMDIDCAAPDAPVKQVSVTVAAEQCSETEMAYFPSSSRLNVAFSSEQCSETVIADYSRQGMKYYNMFDKNSIDRNSTNGEIINYLESNFNSLEKYEVKEPIGYGLLMGSKGPTSKGFSLLSPGVYHDVSNMEEALNRNCKWTTQAIKGVLNSDVLENVLCRLKMEDLGKFSIFLLFYSGHGNKKGVLLDDCCTIPYSMIVKYVSSIDSLKNKPKVFIFDCCRTVQNQEPQELPPFYKYLENMFNREQAQDYYPPPHTLICFSATENCGCHLHDGEGSFYTIALSHSLKQFGKHLSLLEIVTQVNGYARALANTFFDKNSEKYKDQRPIFTSNLDKHLVLNVRSYEEEKAETDAIMGCIPVVCATEESGLHLGAEEFVYKGQDTRCNPPQEGGRSFSHSLRDVEIKSEWKSRDDIERNFRCLGDGISVFFIYAPNPDDPYKIVSSQDPLEQRNRYLMCRLFHDLERHGFHVVSDLHLGDTEPANWLKWYVTRIIHCNFVIFVCSPAFKELFQETLSGDKIVNAKARRLLDYSNAIYSGISRELSRGDGRRKFLPVILDNYSASQCVPELFQSGKVFHIKHDEFQRKFKFDDKSRDFEKLVCYMAGIDRMKLEQPTTGAVTVLGDPFETRRMELMMKEEEEKKLLEGPPRGYITLEELRPPPNLVGQPPNTCSEFGVGGNCMSVNQGGRSPSSHQPSSIPIAPPVQPCISSQPPTCKDPSSLPLKAPKRNIYLWLSGLIMSWKFVARHLGLQESDIERITSDYHGIDEHRFQMFRTWEQRCYDDCSYRKLGHVLMKSEKNRHLYDEYVSRVKEIEQIH